MFEDRIWIPALRIHSSQSFSMHESDIKCASWFLRDAELLTEQKSSARAVNLGLKWSTST